MKPFALLFSVLLTFGVCDPLAGAEQTIALGDTRKVAVAVPEGFTTASGTDASGVIALRISDKDESVSLELSFLPDPDGQFASARGRKELMNELFHSFVESSTEKAMRFEELEPRTGAGTYCVFTDASLVGKTSLPRGEYLHLTAGVKTWAGVAVVFRCFSNDTQSDPYRAVLALLRQSVDEKPVPLK